MQVCTAFQVALAVKIWLDLLEGLWSYGGFKFRGSGLPHIFIAPLSVKLCVRPPKVLEVQDCARGPLSPCQVWWGSDFTRRRGGQKRWAFLSVCLFVRHAFKRQRLNARFRYMKALEYRNDF